MSHALLDFSPLRITVMDLPETAMYRDTVYVSFEEMTPYHLVIIKRDPGTPTVATPLRPTLLTLMRDLIPVLEGPDPISFITDLFRTFSLTDRLILCTEMSVMWHPTPDAEWVFGGEPGIVSPNRTDNDAKFTLASTALSLIAAAIVSPIVEKNWGRVSTTSALLKAHRERQSIQLEETCS